MSDAASRPTKKQRELLQFIEGFIAGHGYGPSYREIMRSLGYKSVSTVAIHVDNLIAKGFLTKLTHSARSLSLTHPSATLAADKPVKSGDSHWLVKQVESRFAAYKTKPSKKLEDELFVLVGALHVLGLNKAAASFKAKLTALKTD